MSKEKHSYNISLDVSSSAASKQVLKELQTAFANSNEDMDALNDSFKVLLKNTKDIEAAEKQYNKVVEKSLADRAKQIDQLNAEKVAIVANKDLTEEQRKEALRLRDIQIDILDSERKSIEAKRDELAITIKAAKAEQEREKKLAKAKEKEAKLLEKLNKTFKSNLTENSKMFKLTNQMVKTQERLNGLLGKESKLRQTMGKLASKAGKVAKVGGGIAGMAIGAAGALAGGAMASVGSIAEKENALKALKSGVTEGDVERVFISTGSDYSTIVTAINKLSRKFKGDDLIAAAIQEVKNPGFADMIMATSDLNMSAKNLGSALEQIKKSSGVLDLSEAMAASTKSRNVTTNKISQSDYVQAYAALQSAGLDTDKINKIIDAVARKGGNFIDEFNKTNLSRYVQGQQKIQIQGIKLNSIDPTKASPKSAAERLLETQNKLALAKDKLMMKVLPPLAAVLEELANNDQIGKLITDLVNTFVKVLPPVMNLLSSVLEVLEPVAKVLIDALLKFLKAEAPKQQQKSIAEANESASKLRAEGKVLATVGMSMGNAVFAQGGLATAPSICGEAGPELVLPLDYSRAGRASSIINNFNTTQSFNMNANQSTPLAFSQAVGQNRFVRRCAG